MPRQLYPKGVEQSYAAALLHQLGNVHGQLLRRVYPVAKLELLHPGIRRDDPRDINSAMTTLRLEVVNQAPTLEATVETIGERTSDAADEQLRRQFAASLGITVPVGGSAPDARLQAFVGENVALIKSLDTRYLDEVEILTTRALADGTRWEELAEQLQDRLGVAESRAALIARDQVGKFYGQIQQVRQTGLGIEAYNWETAGDEKVREEHAVLQGKRFTWASGGAPGEGHPGEPINCRCTPSPDISGLLESL